MGQQQGQQLQCQQQLQRQPSAFQLLSPSAFQLRHYRFQPFGFQLLAPSAFTFASLRDHLSLRLRAFHLRFASGSPSACLAASTFGFIAATTYISTSYNGAPAFG